MNWPQELMRLEGEQIGDGYCEEMCCTPARKGLGILALIFGVWSVVAILAWGVHALWTHI